MGASVDSTGVLLTGLAGMLAGACSMALGEWVSVTSSHELELAPHQLLATCVEFDLGHSTS